MPHETIMNERKIIFLVGASGSGKTVIAQRVASNHECSLVDTDNLILLNSGKEKICDLFASHGESHFRNLESDCIDLICRGNNQKKVTIVATGGGLPAIPGIMNRLNMIGITVYLKANLDTLWKRLTTDPRQLDDRPLLQKNGKRSLEELLKQREPFYYQSTLTIDTDQLEVDDVCRVLAGQISG